MQFKEYVMDFFKNFYTYRLHATKSSSYFENYKYLIKNTLFDKLSFSRRLSRRLTFERPHGAEPDRGSRNGRRLTVRKM